MPRAPRPHPVAQPRPVPARRPHGPGDRPLPGAARSRDRGAALCGRLRDPPAPPDHARPRRGAVPPLGFRRARHQHRTRTAHRRSPGMHPGPLRGALLLVAERHGAARAVQLGRDHLQVLLHGGAGAARSAVAEPGLCLRCAVPAGHQRASEHRPPSHQPMILPLPSPPPATDPPILLSIPSQVLPAGFLEEGILVLDRKRIRRRYLRSSSFLWDVASVLPMELLCLRLRSALRSNRCLRAPRLFEAFERRETRTAHPHAFRIAKLMLYVLVAIHWNACLYFALSVHLGLGSDTWVHPNGSRPGFARPLRQYLHSFYISTLILTTVGDTPEPCREEEFLFVTAGFLLAVLGFATIMGSMSSVIADMSAADASFYPEHGPVRRFLRAHGVAERLVRRVAAWHEHLRAQRKLAEEHVVLRHLPERLRAEVAAGVHLPALSKVRLFQSCERGVLEALVLRLRPQVFGPGEFVCRRGDVGREMYFIREGRLEVLGADGVTQLAVLGEGLYFGEISLINIPGNRSGNRRTADIRSIGYADLFCLAKEDLAEVLTEFPTARVLLEAKGREILLRMDKLDVHAEAAAAAAREEAERRAQVLEAALEALQTRTARLLAQLESSALKLALRIGRLESRAQQRGKWGQGKGRKRSPSRLQCAAGGGEPEGRPTRAQNPTKAQGPTSVQSPRGVQGPTTARGPIGIAGPTGTRRPTRARGPTWARGSTGVGGPIGTRGPTGAGGPTRGRGPTGVGGPIGTRGPTGVGGPTRGRGPTGVGGLIGTRGPTGAWAPSGARGPTGTRGPTGVGGPSRGQDPTGARGTQPRGRWR